MLATFCARVALGLAACLLLLSPRQLHPRFFRTQLLTALGLLVVATGVGWPDAAPWTRGLLFGTTVLALLGALSWTLDPPPAGWAIVVALAGTLVAALTAMLPEAAGWMFYTPGSDMSHPPLVVGSADQITSSLFLGTMLTAMLVGHSYLISPGMTLTPLMRCLLAGSFALVARIAVIGWGLWRWTELNPTYNLNNEVVLCLPVRWLVGIVAPLGFGWMAFSAARIRSTQSATGILYVVVVCGFLGELLGLLLTRQTGLPL
jgi:hypothetical protein